MGPNASCRASNAATARRCAHGDRTRGSRAGPLRRYSNVAVAFHWITVVAGADPGPGSGFTFAEHGSAGPNAPSASPGTRPSVRLILRARRSSGWPTGSTTRRRHFRRTAALGTCRGSVEPSRVLFPADRASARPADRRVGQSATGSTTACSAAFAMPDHPGMLRRHRRDVAATSTSCWCSRPSRCLCCTSRAALKQQFFDDMAGRRAGCRRSRRRTGEPTV